MTFRTRSVEKRGRRRSTTAHADARRNLFLNIGFGIGIIAALSILGGVLLTSWYSDHWAPILTVSGHKYSTDDVKARVALIKAQDAELTQTYQDLRNAGKISESDYSNFTSQLGQVNQSGVTQRAVNQLISESVVGDYAAKNNISVDDNAMKAQITKDATVAELRHIKVIAVMPTPSDPSAGATASDVAAAQAKAQQLHDKITSGQGKWDDVAKESDAGFLANPSGDLGTATKDSFSIDPVLLDAAFNLQKANDVTAVVKCADGIFRFATVTSITPPSTNQNYESQLQAKGANLDAYHSEARAAALQDVVKQQVIKANVETPTTQRHVLEMFFNSAYNSASDEEVKAKVAIFAPNHDTSAGATLNADDPKWADAKKRADDFYAQIKADPSKFSDLTKTQSDDKIFRDGGGQLPFLPQTVFGASSSGGLDWTELGSQLFDSKRAANDIIAPVKTNAGYAVAIYEARRPGPQQRMVAAQLRLNAGVDFGAVARDVSDSSDAANGGDLGWVSPNQLGQDEEKAIYAAKIGDTITYTPSGSSQTGTYLFKIVGEEKRAPDAEQATRLKVTVFSNWLNNEVSSSSNLNEDAKLQSMISAEQNPTQP